MHPDPAEIVTEVRFHAPARFRIERLAGGVQDLVHHFPGCAFFVLIRVNLGVEQPLHGSISNEGLELQQRV